MATLKDKARGTDIEMADGKVWKVPFLPINRKGITILKKFEESAPPTDGSPRDLDKEIMASLDGMKMLMAINYPDITDEEVDGLCDSSNINEITAATTGMKKTSDAGVQK